MFANTSINYSVLTILSNGKRSFENLGRLIKKSGDTVRSMLQPRSKSCALTQGIAQKMFLNAKLLYLTVDDTLLKKIYSFLMEGSGDFFDTKLYRKIRAYRLIMAIMSDGKSVVPLSFDFMFAKEFLSDLDKVQSKLDFVKMFYALAKNFFPIKES